MKRGIGAVVTKPLLAVVIALTAAACASSSAATTPHHAVDIHDGGGDFLPAYMDMLQGKQPFPKDTCEAHTLADLMLGNCDQGGAR
jgi:hypothetical protein